MGENEPEISRPLLAALYRILTAVARVALKRGVPYDAVAELAKQAFVEVAFRDFKIEGRKQSAARVSVLTGIHRKDVARVLASERSRDDAAADRVTCGAGVVAGWRRDRRYQDARGAPAALAFEGRGPTFSELVRRYGIGDTPPRAVLDELVRVGAATRARDGRVRLLASAYVPETASPEALAILGGDVSDLISTIDHNLVCAPGAGFFQRKVAYDNVPAEALEPIRELVEGAGQDVLVKLDRSIAKHDRDSNPKVSGTGRNRVMVGVYYFEDELPED
jgi:hypothetical protein